MKKIKEVVVISGKGGTGKTTITASLAELVPGKVLVDADVDAANLVLLLGPNLIKKGDFQGKPIAFIDQSRCTACQLCQELCRFDAVCREEGFYWVDEFGCDGCRLCETACPVQAIEMNDQIVGQWMVADTSLGKFVYARLKPGSENSGKLVTKVKHLARKIAEEKNLETILIDGPPGIGCPVISTLSGSDYALVVTEPSLSAMGDLERTVQLARHFQVTCGIIINKYDINLENSEHIERFAGQKDIDIIARIPHSPCIMREITQQRIPFKVCPDLKMGMEMAYDKIKVML